MKKISYLFYKFLRFIDLFFKILKRDGILIWFNDFINKDFYMTKDIAKEKVTFFIPNQITKWRVDTLFSKEPETIEWIDNFHQTNDRIIFWDIGANIGLYSIYAAKIHKNIEIVSFEPSTSNLRILSRNISVNDLNEKISICQLPIGVNTNTNLVMHESEFKEGWSMNTFGEPTNYEGKFFEAKQTYRLYGTSIDYLFINKIYRAPNYLKIDVDGIEDKILQGGIKVLLDSNLKSISVELNENFKSQFEKVKELMKHYKFKFKQKKHADFYDNDKKFSKVYNYIFER